MSNYKLRLTQSYHDCSGVIQKIASHCDSIAVYEHSENCERVHVHAIIFGLRRGYDTVVDWMKSLCPVKTDRQLCTTYGKGKDKKPVDLGFISYMSKGKYDPVYVQGISDEDIADKKALGFTQEHSSDVVDIITTQGGKLVKNVSPSKKLQIQLLEEMKAELDTEHPTDDMIYKVIRKVCIKNHYYLPRGIFKIMEFRDNLLFHLNSEDLHNDYKIAIARRQRI